VLRIGEFSKLGKVTVKTLHHWDDVDLLIPEEVDPVNGYRYYGVNQLVKVAEILRLQSLGFSLADIADLIAGRDGAELLERRRLELLAEQSLAAQRLLSLDHYVHDMKEQLMTYDITTTTIPACTVFAYDTVIPNYDALHQIMPKIGALVAKANPGLEYAPDDYRFNVYLDEEYRDHDVHVEICQTVVRPGVDADGIVFRKLPEITAACVTHSGAYEGIGKAFAAVIGWVNDHGYEIVGPIRESYLDGDWNQPDPANWRTQIQVPIKAA
jgi:DNA-binding transcriptional MerR regulator